MKIELKNIYVAERLSEHSTAFDAALYINDIRVGRAGNSGQGGPTTYTASTVEGRKLIKQAKNWCASLPPTIIDLVVKGKPLRISVDLELYMDRIIAAHLKKKELNRFEKEMERDMGYGILYGIPGTEYRVVKFKSPVEELLKSEAGIKVIKGWIHGTIFPSLKEGEKILNANIGPEGVKALGIDPERIVKNISLGKENNLKQELLERSGEYKRKKR